MQPRRFLALLAATLTLLPAVAHAVPPVNDNFANRIVLSGQAVSSGPISTSEATREGLEPSNIGGQTVWWTWAAPLDGIVTITSQGTSYNNLLTVFTGEDFAGLSQIAQNQASAASVTFPVKAGLVYQMSIGSTFIFGENGTATINLRNAPTNITAPVVVGLPSRANDNFANSAVLSGPAVSGFTYNTEATREGQEPSFTGARTVWWTWIAPADAQVTMSTAGTNFGALLSVFNGDELSEVKLVAYNQGNPAKVTFPAKAGFIYHVPIGMVNSGDNGVPVLNIITAPISITSPVIIGSLASANDNYANAQTLGNYQTVSGFGYNSDATIESLEPATDGGHTLWWTWTAPGNGTLVVNFNGSDNLSRFNINVYTGDTIASAINVSNIFTASQNSVQGKVQAGTTYHFVLGASSVGTVALNLNLSPSGVLTPPFFSGQTPLDNGVYFLRFGGTNNPFGYYSYLSDPHYIFHFDLGYEYVFDANDGKSGVYLYDFKSNGFFYTSPNFPFPYLYDFSLKTVLYYFPNPNNEGRYNTNGIRYFVRLDTGQIFSK